MSQFDEMPRELGWDDEIENDGSPYEALPEGDYDFRVEKFERARHGGSEKIPACNKAILTLSVVGQEGRGTVQTNLFLYSKFEWKLCQFFTSIGHRKHGERLRMNWPSVPGSTGRCHVGVRSWTGNDGKERKGNEVTEFYEPDESMTGWSQTSEAPPSQWASPSASGGYTPGKF